MIAKERARSIISQFDSYAYLPEIEQLIVEAIEQAEIDAKAITRERCALVADKVNKGQASLGDKDGAKVAWGIAFEIRTGAMQEQDNG